jgi:hypothetical protein
MDWTFAEILERCAYGADLHPGDVIGSGTVGTGCFLELNGTGKFNDPNYTEQWLQEGDVVEMEIDGIGKISNTRLCGKTVTLSLFAKKKVESHEITLNESVNNHTVSVKSRLCASVCIKISYLSLMAKFFAKTVATALAVLFAAYILKGVNGGWHRYRIDRCVCARTAQQFYQTRS